MQRKEPGYKERRREAIIAELVRLHLGRFDVGGGPFEEDGINSPAMRELARDGDLWACIDYDARHRAVVMVDGSHPAISRPGWVELTPSLGCLGLHVPRMPFGRGDLYRLAVDAPGLHLYITRIFLSWLREAAKRGAIVEQSARELSAKGYSDHA